MTTISKTCPLDSPQIEDRDGTNQNLSVVIAGLASTLNTYRATMTQAPGIIGHVRNAAIRTTATG